MNFNVMILLNKLRLMLSYSIVLRYRLNSKFTREPLIYYVRIFLSFLDPLILKVNIFFALKIRKLQFYNFLPPSLPTSAYVMYEWFLANHEKKSFRGPKTSKHIH